MRKVLFAFFLFIPCLVHGQDKISGIVLDANTHEPLPYATVYINGSTKGTVTDEDGEFELDGISFPATVVSSFTGYTPNTVNLVHSSAGLLIELQTNNELPEVEITKDNKWSSDYEFFKRYFLGEDRFGRNATILNDEVLSFDRSRFVKKIMLYEGHEMDEMGSKFTAYAREPVIVDLPLLGYELSVDLVDFSVVHWGGEYQCNILGYFYFKPYDTVNESELEKFETNRRAAYYSSSRHFLKSLYENRLKENGFIVYDTRKESKFITKWEQMDISRYMENIGDGLMQIQGLSDKRIKVEYYHKIDGSPLELGESRTWLRSSERSGISFLSDTCCFTMCGIVPDNSIRFSGDMSEKRVAASLPVDYLPSNDIPNDSIPVVVERFEPIDTCEVWNKTEKELMRFAANIHQFNQVYPQEKVYLQFDNTSYYAGETMWFKAFVVNASDNRRAASKVLYVDLISPGGEVLKQEKLKIVAGQADGSFALNDGATAHARELRGVLPYPSGFYEVRAYTSYMLNFSDDIVFSRVLPVFEKPEKDGNYYGEKPVIAEITDPEERLTLERIPPKPIKGIDVSFYPEGGHLIVGVPNRVAFKVLGSDGLGVNVDGILNDSIPITCLHDGMGSFVFTPQRNNNRVEFTCYDSKYRFTLPNAERDGFVLSVDRKDGNIIASVIAAGEVSADTLGITLTCRGEIMDFKTVSASDSKVEFPTDRIPEGVSRLTLFDRKGTVIATRYVYVKGKLAVPQITVSFDKKRYEPFELMKLDFELVDGAGYPFRDRFCLSVRDSECPSAAIGTDIRSSLLLSSDLRGLVYKPEYYFESDDELHTQALDLLMLVQGWEKYDWSIRAGTKKFDEVHRLEKNLTLGGWVLHHFSDDPVVNDSVGMALEPLDERLIQGLQCRTDSSGYFHFDVKDFYNTAKLTLVVKPDNHKSLLRSKRLLLERSLGPELKRYSLADLTLVGAEEKVHNDKVETDYPIVIKEDLGIILPEADIDDSRIFVDYFTFKAFDVRRDAQAMMDAGEYSTDMRGYLLEKGLWNKLMADTSIAIFSYVHDSKGFLYSKEEPGNPLSADVPDDIIDIVSLQVFDSPMYMYDILKLFPMYRKSLDKRLLTPPLENGKRFWVVDVHVRDSFRYDNSREGYDLSRRETTMDGFSQPFEFYSPQYPDGVVYGDVDYRRTLYWNPNVITNALGRAHVEFYNNSYSTGFRVTGAGITAGGTPYVLDAGL